MSDTPRAVVAIASNKGGVGKTTVATNLAIYLRALHEELPVLLVGLDDQSVIDRMFRLGGAASGGGGSTGSTGSTGPGGRGERNLKHAWAERSFDDVMQMGQYGIHYVPTPPDTAALKGRAEDPRTLRRILDRTHFDGLVLLDTKSDLEALTRNALAAADEVILPVADFASFQEAAKAFALLEHLQRGRPRGRVLFTLVDRRTRVDASGRDLHERLVEAVAERGWPRYRAVLSRSPRLEALNSASGAPGSVLHYARGTLVHRELRELAEEVGQRIGLVPSAAPLRAPARPEAEARPAAAGLAQALLRGLTGGRR